MPRFKKPHRPISYIYYINHDALLKRWKPDGLPLATRILCLATNERSVTAHAKELWNEWIEATGFLPSPLPSGRFMLSSDHSEDACGVISHGRIGTNRPYPRSQHTFGLRYPRATDNLDGYGQPMEGKPKRTRSPMEIEIAAAKKLLGKPVRKVRFHTPARRKIGDPTWIPILNFDVFGRSPAQWNAEAMKEWKRLALEEIRDAHSVGDHPYPPPRTREEIDRYFRRLPSGTQRSFYPLSVSNLSHLPCDPVLGEIRDRHLAAANPLHITPDPL